MLTRRQTGDQEAEEDAERRDAERREEGMRG
jgi:hypothetical protein